jgi:hypothetical protein
MRAAKAAALAALAKSRVLGWTIGTRPRPLGRRRMSSSKAEHAYRVSL